MIYFQKKITRLLARDMALVGEELYDWIEIVANLQPLEEKAGDEFINYRRSTDRNRVLPAFKLRT